MSGRWVYPPVPEGYKFCPVCETTKLATTDFFHKKPDAPDGLKRQCKECVVRIRKQPEQHAHEIATGRAYYAAHREERIAQSLAWEATHQEHVRARKARQKAKPQERVKARERTRNWYATHREYALAYNKIYSKAYITTHPDKVREYKLRRRANKANAQGSHTEKQLKELYQRQKGRCYYCNSKFGTGKNAYHADHVVPLSRGGTNDISNIVLVCPDCNLSKGHKLLHEWVKGGRLL